VWLFLLLLLLCWSLGLVWRLLLCLGANMGGYKCEGAWVKRQANPISTHSSSDPQPWTKLERWRMGGQKAPTQTLVYFEFALEALAALCAVSTATMCMAAARSWHTPQAQQQQQHNASRVTCTG
jgi:hypothetical protein